MKPPIKATNQGFWQQKNTAIFCVISNIGQPHCSEKPKSLVLVTTLSKTHPYTWFYDFIKIQGPPKERGSKKRRNHLQIAMKKTVTFF